jgi:hypothetical protein
MTTIKQRGNGDCAVAATAMFLGKTYDEIVDLFPEAKDGFPNGTHAEVEVCLHFGIMLECVHLPGHARSLNEYYDMDMSQPAMVVVLSQNKEDALHMIYWDGKEIHDPSNLKCYGPEFPDAAYVSSIAQKLKER